jgi:DNA-directed RNA polymerase specialized sigma24 family protein
MSESAPFAEFLRRIRSGDAAAAEELVRRYESAIRLAVRTRLTDPALKRHFDSVDVCQSVLASFFFRAAAGQYDLNNPSQLIALLVRMAQNKLAGRARFHRRQRRGAGQVVGLDSAAETAAGGEAGPVQVAIGRELLQALRHRLTPEERELADRRGAGQGWPEIATDLGGTANGLRIKLKRALDRIAPELGLDENDSREEGDA